PGNQPLVPSYRKYIVGGRQSCTGNRKVHTLTCLSFHSHRLIDQQALQLRKPAPRVELPYSDNTQCVSKPVYRTRELLPALLADSHVVVAPGIQVHAATARYERMVQRERRNHPGERGWRMFLLQQLNPPLYLARQLAESQSLPEFGQRCSTRPASRLSQPPKHELASEPVVVLQRQPDTRSNQQREAVLRRVLLFVRKQAEGLQQRAHEWHVRGAHGARAGHRKTNRRARLVQRIQVGAIGSDAEYA